MAALAGIRVLDLTTVIFGPYASQTLADYGAEVIKVEALSGDSTRYTGPAHEAGMSAIFLGVNRNKKSIAIDIKTPEGLAIIYELLSHCDIFMHNIRPQKLLKLGLNYEEVKKINSNLIYAGFYGFGSDGPYAGLPAYDDIIQGLSAIPDLISKQSGTPRYMPTIAADKTSALVGVHAILAALFQRTQTGMGQFIEIPMFESMVSFNLVEHYYDQHLVGQAQAKKGYERVISKHRRPYATSDGYLCVMPYTDRHWKSLFCVVGREELVKDSRFITISERTRHIDELYALVAEILQERSTQEWTLVLKELEIPYAVVNTLDTIADDPHLTKVGFFEEVIDSSGKYSFVRNPVRLEQSDVPINMPPRLGEHTEDILVKLGFATDEINTLYQNNIIK